MTFPERLRQVMTIKLFSTMLSHLELHVMRLVDTQLPFQLIVTQQYPPTVQLIKYVHYLQMLRATLRFMRAQLTLLMTELRRTSQPLRYLE